MFCIPLDDRQKWFRYHHLFGQLLQGELKRRFGEKSFLELHNRAGNWFAQHEYPDEALNHMLAAKNITAARKLVIGKRYELTGLEQWHRLERWIEALPKADLHKDPELLIILAWIHESRERIPQMLQVLDSVETQLTEKTGAAKVHLEITGECNALRAAQLYISGDIERARRYIDLSIEQIPKSHPNERAYALIVWALIHQMQGDVTEARRVIYGLLREDESNGSNHDARLLLTLCILNLLEGDLSGLQQYAEQLLVLGKNHSLLESITFANYYIGLVAYYRGNSQESFTYLDSVVKSGLLIDPNSYVHGNCARALLFQKIGQPEKMQTLIQEMLEYAIKSKNSGFLNIIHALQAELALRRGATSEAIKWARDYSFDPLKQSLRFFVPQMTQAKILMTVGTASDREQALDMINRMQQFFAAKNNVHCLIDVLALKAICLDGKGDSEAAIEALTTALKLSHLSRRLEPFLSLGDQMATLLKDVARQGRFKSYVSEILTSIETTASPVDHDAAKHQSILNGQPLDQIQLTNREIDIIQLLANRLSNKDISAKLFIAPSTVQRHASNIYAKLSVSNRQEAVAKARTLGLI
jgi:LuxR family maltose regulon positive regulatory protein